MVTAIPLATDKDRRRKMPRGTSGSSAKRASFTKKMASRTRPTASVHDGAGRSPGVRVGADDPVDQDGQAGGDGDGSQDVECLLGAPLFVPGQRQPGADHQDDADRHVDEEHPPPVEEAGEDPAGEYSDRRSARRGRRPRTEGSPALAWVGERRHQDAQGGRGEDGTADPLGGAGGNEPAPALGQPTDQAEEVKTPRPIMKTRRRPKRSAARPPSIKNPAKVSV